MLFSLLSRSYNAPLRIVLFSSLFLATLAPANASGRPAPPACDACAPLDSVGAPHFNGFLAGKSRVPLDNDSLGVPGASMAPNCSTLAIDADNATPIDISYIFPIPRTFSSAPVFGATSMRGLFLPAAISILAMVLTTCFSARKNWPQHLDQRRHLVDFLPPKRALSAPFFVESPQERLRTALRLALKVAQHALGPLDRTKDDAATDIFTTAEAASLADLGLFTSHDFARFIRAVDWRDLAHYLEIAPDRVYDLYRRCCWANEFCLHWAGPDRGVPLPPLAPAPPSALDLADLPSVWDVSTHFPELRDELSRELLSAGTATTFGAVDTAALSACCPFPRPCLLFQTLGLGSPATLVEGFEFLFTRGDVWRLAAAVDLLASQVLEVYIRACLLTRRVPSFSCPEPLTVGRNHARASIRRAIDPIAKALSRAQRRHGMERPLVGVPAASRQALKELGAGNLESGWVLISFCLDHGLLMPLAAAVSTSVASLILILIRAGWGRKLARESCISGAPDSAKRHSGATILTGGLEKIFSAGRTVFTSLLSFGLPGAFLLLLPGAVAQPSVWPLPDTTWLNTTIPPTMPGDGMSTGMSTGVGSRMLAWMWAIDVTNPWTWAHILAVGIGAWAGIRVLCAVWQLPAVRVVRQSRAVQVGWRLTQPLQRMVRVVVTVVLFVARALTGEPGAPEEIRGRAAARANPEYDESPFARRGRLDFMTPAAEPAAVAVAATPALRPATTTWQSLEWVEQQQWQGGHVPMVRGGNDDKNIMALESRLDRLFEASVGTNKAKHLYDLTPSQSSAEVPVGTVLSLLHLLEAIRDAVVVYAKACPGITVAEMQYLLQNLLRRQAGTKWTALTELCEREPDITWARVTKHACNMFNVQSHEDWETILQAFTRTSGGRNLTLSEFIHRFRIVAQASVMLRSPYDAAFVYELLLRGAQTPGFVRWAQRRMRIDTAEMAETHDAYASLRDGIRLAMAWETLSQDQRDEAIREEAQLSDRAIGRLFRCLKGASIPSLGVLWPKDLRGVAYMALEDGLRASTQKRVETMDKVNNFPLLPRDADDGGKPKPAPKQKKEGRKWERGEKKGPERPPEQPFEPLVPRALEGKGDAPAPWAIRRHRDCLQCGRFFPDCRMSASGATDPKLPCSHPAAAQLRPLLFAYARYPSIFAPTIDGRRVTPTLNDAEKAAFAAFVTRAGLSNHYTIGNFLAAPEAPRNEPINVFLNALETYLASAATYVADGGVVDPAWIADCIVGNSTVHALVDTCGGVGMIAEGLVEREGLEIQPYYGRQVTLGAHVPLYIKGSVTVPFRTPFHPDTVFLPDMCVVPDHILPRDQPLLLGVSAITQLRCVPDLSAGRLYWKGAQELNRTTPWQTLETTPRPWDPAGQQVAIMMATEVTLLPGQTREVPCYMDTPIGMQPPARIFVVTARYQPGNEQEEHPRHSGLASPGALSAVGSPLPIDANPILQRLQRVTLALELSNFGDQAIVLQANERISETETVSVDHGIRQQALRHQLEADRAVAIVKELNARTRDLAQTIPLAESPGSSAAQLVEEIIDFLLSEAEGLRVDCPAAPSLSTPAISPMSECDGLDDADAVALPETVPEEEVLREALQAMQEVMSKRLDLTRSERFQLVLLLARHVPVFRYVLRPPEQLVTTAERLHIDSSEQPRFTRQYPQPQAKIEAARKIGSELLQQGVVEPCTSNWNSPVLLVPKKDGTWRFAIDYRRVNAVTEMDPAAIPNPKLTLHTLGGNKWFTCCDLLSSFWQQPLHPEDRHYTAFSLPELGQLQWTVVPMGLKNSPQVQQRTMERILRGLNPERVLCYIDDVVVASPTFQEHLVMLDLMFRRLEAAGLVLKFRKCEIARPAIVYLGHILSADGLGKDPRLVQKVTEFPIPRSALEVRGFLGLTGYYRDFVPHFTEMALPLTELSSVKKTFEWTGEAQLAFNNLQKAMASPQVLALPDWNRHFILATDASDRGIGGVLAQNDDQGRQRPILFVSRKLMPAETRYSTTEREALAVVTCVTKLRHYLLGRRFTLLTDHDALVHLLGENAPAPVGPSGEPRRSARLVRWSLLMSQYEFDAIHVPGNRMAVPDYLSRYAGGMSDPESDAKIAQHFAHPWLGAWDLSAKHVFLNREQGPEFLRTLQQEDPLLEALITGARPDGRAAATRKLLAIYNSSRPADQQVSSVPSRWRGIDWERLKLSREGVLLYEEREEETGKVRRCLVVPPQLRRLIMEEKHDGNHAGHAGTKRTVARIAEKYWWPAMADEVASYVGSCLKCLRIKPTRGRWTNGLMQPLPVVFQPFERVSVDILTVQENGNRFKHVLVMLDHATRFLEVAPLRTKTAEEVAEVIYTRLFERYGPVVALLSDRGGEFTADICHALYRTMGARHVATSPYHPQTNGANERVNSTFLPYLRAFAEHDPDHWFEYLGAAQYAYNTSYQTSLAATPFFLMYGRDPVDTVDQTMEELLGEDAERPTAELWSYRLEAARFLAQQHLIATQEANAARVNRNRHEAEDIQEHSWVFLKPAMERQTKLANFGLGLFRVVSRRGNALDLQDEQGQKRQANISDVVLVRHPPQSCTVMDPYQVVRALIHQHAVASPTAPSQSEEAERRLGESSPASPWDSSYSGADEEDTSDVGTPGVARRIALPPSLSQPLKEKMEENDFAETAEAEVLGQQVGKMIEEKGSLDQVGGMVEEEVPVQHPSETEKEKDVSDFGEKLEEDHPAEDRVLARPTERRRAPLPTSTMAAPQEKKSVANRIVDVAVRERRLYIQIGYRDEPDQPTDQSWYFYKDLAQPSKLKWLRKFVKNNVVGIKASGWKSLPGLLAEVGAPVTLALSVQQ